MKDEDDLAAPLVARAAGKDISYRTWLYHHYAEPLDPFSDEFWWSSPAGGWRACRPASQSSDLPAQVHGRTSDAPRST